MKTLFALLVLTVIGIAAVGCDPAPKAEETAAPVKAESAVPAAAPDGDTKASDAK